MLTVMNKGDEITNNGKVALLFHIPGHCAGCKRVISILETKKLEDWTVYLLDAESGDFKDLAEKYNATKAPTLIILENGEYKQTIEGLKAFIENKGIFGE